MVQSDGTFEVVPIGHVESTLTDTEQAPRQGSLGAPDAWLVLEPEVRAGARDIAVGDELVVLTWLHQSRRDELSTVPGSDPGGPERGVFSTRSPARPNPIGLHDVTSSRSRTAGYGSDRWRRSTAHRWWTSSRQFRIDSDATSIYS